MNYTIQTVSPPKVWQGQHGEFVDYWLGLDEFPQDRVALTQKPETAAPIPGQVVAGDIVQKPNGMYKLAKDQQATQQAGLRQRAETLTERHQGTNVPLRTPDLMATFDYDEREHCITRQHSQEMAIRFLAMLAEGVMEKPGLEEVLRMTDWFDADAWKSRRPGAAPRNPDVHVPQQGLTSTPALHVPGQHTAPLTGTVAVPAGTNGGQVRLASPMQVEKFLRPRMAQLDPTSLRSLLDQFGINRVEDLPMQRVDEFANAMTQPIRTGESDIPSPEPLPVRQVETDPSFPF